MNRKLFVCILVTKLLVCGWHLDPLFYRSYNDDNPQSHFRHFLFLLTTIDIWTQSPLSKSCSDICHESWLSFCVLHNLSSMGLCLASPHGSFTSAVTAMKTYRSVESSTLLSLLLSIFFSIIWMISTKSSINDSGAIFLYYSLVCTCFKALYTLIIRAYEIGASSLLMFTATVGTLFMSFRFVLEVVTYNKY